MYMTIWSYLTMLGEAMPNSCSVKSADVQLNPYQLELHCIYILWTTKHIGMKHVDLSDWEADSRY